jgi:hypothetical protein
MLPVATIFVDHASHLVFHNNLSTVHYTLYIPNLDYAVINFLYVLDADIIQAVTILASPLAEAG